MKRLKNLLGAFLSTIALALKWIGNILAFPFISARKVNNRDLVILGAAGIAFTIAGILSLNVKWAPPLDEAGLYVSIAVCAIGIIMLIFSTVGFIK